MNDVSRPENDFRVNPDLSPAENGDHEATLGRPDQPGGLTPGQLKRLRAEAIMAAIPIVEPDFCLPVSQVDVN